MQLQSRTEFNTLILCLVAFRSRRQMLIVLLFTQAGLFIDGSFEFFMECIKVYERLYVCIYDTRI